MSEKTTPIVLTAAETAETYAALIGINLNGHPSDPDASRGAEEKLRRAYYRTSEEEPMGAIGTIVLTVEQIKEIEGGGCVTAETKDGVKVNVVFD